MVERLPAHTFETLRDQAALQLERRTTGRLDWHPVDADPGCGFELLPRPSAGDVIFDIEGDPFWEPARGLHFLFGLLLRDGADWKYRALWAHDRLEERRLLEEFVDVVHERLERDAGMHVYHYGAYEKTAVTQLMGAYATREDAVDELLRRKVFVNLYTVVRQGLRAGVPSYSLKEIEALAAFVRRADLRSGTRAVLTYERWMETRDDTLLAGIAAYNDEDCRATLALRDWLVTRRPDGTSWAEAVAAEARDDTGAGEREALRRALVEGAAPGSPGWLAGEVLEYHRREARPAWWRFFERRDHMTIEELVRGALARLASSMLAGDARYPALRDILGRRPPRLRSSGPGGVVQTIDVAEQRALGAGLDASYLFIQGPPGTGKTWTGARLITELMRRGRRVGLAASSHKAIHNLLAEVEKAASEEGLRFRGLKKASGGNDESFYDVGSITNVTDIGAFARAGSDVLLFAGTAWLFAHRDLDAGATPAVDTLVIDEAGQVSLADGLAMGTSARTPACTGLAGHPSARCRGLGAGAPAW